MYKFTKFDKMNLKIAILTSELSYCQKRKVGAVIVKDNRIISNGYNGTITGTGNNCEDKYVVCICCNEKVLLTEDVLNTTDEIDDRMLTTCSCGASVYFTNDVIELKTNDKVIHAEQNALIFAAKHGISVAGATMYISTEPCINCAKAIAESGIEKVIYKDFYKDNNGSELLNSIGIDCIKYDLLEL